MSRAVKLHGRVLINGYIRTVTGLHIGKGKEGVAIGGVDNPVMRDPLTNAPYIPGSSLKGKLRSLLVKSEGLPINFPPGSNVQIHVSRTEQEYLATATGRLFGVPGDKEFAKPTRLVVRDVQLSDESKLTLREADVDLPFTEIKYEATIDRVTARAMPRPLERVPANSVFGPFTLLFSLYEAGDTVLLRSLFEAMNLLEDDYLGGSGSRGSGQVKFEKIQVMIKPVSSYQKAAPNLDIIGPEESLTGIIEQLDNIIEKVNVQILVTETKNKDGDPSGEETTTGDAQNV